MNFLYLSPEFPPNYRNFAAQLSTAGVSVYGIGEAEFHNLSQELQQSLKWYVRCPNMRQIDSFGAALDHLVNDVMKRKGWGTIDVVESHNEFWMAHEAFANEKLGLAGIRPHDMARLKKKSAMKAIFTESDLKTAEGAVISSATEGLTLAKRLGYPLILKPDEGVGASGVRKISSEHELRDALSQNSGPYLLEQFIQGRMVTFDGLTDWDGNIVYASSLAYGCGVLENVMGEDTFFYVRREIPSKLAAIGERLVRAFAIKRKFFHFEFFDLDGEYLPVEINARPPGGAIIDMMNYSADIDLYRWYATLITAGPGSTLELHSAKRFFCGFAGRKDKRYRHSHQEILTTLGLALVEHGENPALYWDGMGRYRYIFRSPFEEAIQGMRNFVLATEAMDLAA